MDGLHLEATVVDGLREDVVDGEGDRLLVEVVLQNHKSSVHSCSSEIHEALDVVVSNGGVDRSSSNLPVLSVWRRRTIEISL